MVDRSLQEGRTNKPLRSGYLSEKLEARSFFDPICFHQQHLRSFSRYLPSTIVGRLHFLIDCFMPSSLFYQLIQAMLISYFRFSPVGLVKSF